MIQASGLQPKINVIEPRGFKHCPAVKNKYEKGRIKQWDQFKNTCRSNRMQDFAQLRYVIAMDHLERHNDALLQDLKMDESLWNVKAVIGHRLKQTKRKKYV